jgi:hypothetical protein
LTKLWFCIHQSLSFWRGEVKTEDFEMNGSKYSPNLICS